jgi:hypothetical protein
LMSVPDDRGPLLARARPAVFCLQFDLLGNAERVVTSMPAVNQHALGPCARRLKSLSSVLAKYA